MCDAENGSPGNFIVKIRESGYGVGLGNNLAKTIYD